MRRAVLIICDSEEGYACRLMDYLNRKEHFFEICVFTSVEALLAYIGTHRADILLIAEELMEEQISHQMPGRIILLSEGGEKRREAAYLTLSKLQPAENIEKELVNSYLATEPQAVGGAKGALRLWGIFSPVGGCGKTSLALAMGKQLARKKKVLYLSLESFGSLTGEGGYKAGMTDLLYYVKERKENLSLLLSSLVEGQQGLDCLPPVDYYGDLQAVTEEDVDYLLAELEKSSYELILLDMGCITSPLLYLLSQCQRIFLPCRKEEASGKMLALERSLRMEEREELLLRMERILLPKPQGAEMEQLLWELLQNELSD